MMNYYLYVMKATTRKVEIKEDYNKNNDEYKNNIVKNPNEVTNTTLMPNNVDIKVTKFDKFNQDGELKPFDPLRPIDLSKIDKSNLITINLPGPPSPTETPYTSNLMWTYGQEFRNNNNKPLYEV